MTVLTVLLGAFSINAFWKIRITVGLGAIHCSEHWPLTQYRLLTSHPVPVSHYNDFSSSWHQLPFGICSNYLSHKNTYSAQTTCIPLNCSPVLHYSIFWTYFCWSYIIFHDILYFFNFLGMFIAIRNLTPSFAFLFNTSILHSCFVAGLVIIKM